MEIVNDQKLQATTRSHVFTMSKRASSGTDGVATFRKRQKVVHEAPTSEEVTSSAQLRRLLSFDQDLRNSRHGRSSMRMKTLQ